MSLGDEIMLFLSNHPGNYRDLRRHMLGDLYFEEKFQEKSRLGREQAKRERILRVTLSNLKRKDLIESKDSFWQITTTGLKKIKDRLQYRKHSAPTKNKSNNRKMIIAFDIPQDKSRSRYWLRIELVGLGFKMMQKSVWLGPAPLPQEFIEHIKTLDLLPHLKFFEVKKTDIV